MDYDGDSNGHGANADSYGARSPIPWNEVCLVCYAPRCRARDLPPVSIEQERVPRANWSCN
jgi:hypothetical protein